MRRSALLLAVLVPLLAMAAAPARAQAPAECPLCGQWRSDAARTTADLDRNASIDELTRVRLRNGRVVPFGQMRFEITADTWCARMPGDADPSDDCTRYRVVEQSPGRVVTEGLDPPPGVDPRMVVRIVDGCLVVPVRVLPIDETFCREAR